MPLANWIQLGALLITITTLIIQQRVTLNSSRAGERRTETKLKIFYLVQTDDLSEDEILAALRRGSPLATTNEVEVRKALYEMLTDETIRFTRTSKYKARTRKPRGGKPDADEEEENATTVA
jgi:hypothetical protein